MISLINNLEKITTVKINLKQFLLKEPTDHCCRCSCIVGIDCRVNLDNLVMAAGRVLLA